MRTLTKSQIEQIVSEVSERDCMSADDFDNLREELEVVGLDAMVQLTSRERDVRLTIQLNRPGFIHSFGFEPKARTANATRSTAGMMQEMLDIADELWDAARSISA